jgi:MFS family permease
VSRPSSAGPPLRMERASVLPSCGIAAIRRQDGHARPAHPTQTVSRAVLHGQGGVVFGHIGDKVGRKGALVATLLIVGLGTVAVGLMPSYERIGKWAPIGIVVIRLLQGFGVGGEQGNAIPHYVRARTARAPRILWELGPDRSAGRFPAAIGVIRPRCQERLSSPEAGAFRSYSVLYLLALGCISD